MTEARGLLADGVVEATIGRPAVDAEQLGHAEVEAIVRGWATEVSREIPRAFHEPRGCSKRHRHGEEESQGLTRRLLLEVMPDDHSTEHGRALEDEQARRYHLDASDDPRTPERPGLRAIVLDDEQLECEACVEANHSLRHVPPPVPHAVPRSRISSRAADRATCPLPVRSSAASPARSSLVRLPPARAVRGLPSRSRLPWGDPGTKARSAGHHGRRRSRARTDDRGPDPG